MKKHSRFESLMGGVLLLALLLTLIGCQDGTAILPPDNFDLPEIPSTSVSNSINVPGIITELDNPPAGMSVEWSIPSSVSTLTKIAMMTNTLAADPESDVSIVAKVSFNNYTGQGVVAESGITSIRTGSITITFTGTSSTESSTTTATLPAFSVEYNSLLLVQRDGSRENTYTLSATNISGNNDTDPVTIAYPASTAEGETITNPTVNVPESQNNVTMNPGMTATVDGEELDLLVPWDGSVNTGWYNEAETTFTITTPSQLAGLAKIVNDGTDSFDNKTIILGSDINLGNLAWTPIGSIISPLTNEYTGKEQDYNLFKGSFDGNSKKISNLNVQCSSNSNTGNGLFGVVGSGAEISNFTIENCQAVGSSSSFFVGAFVGLIPHCNTTPTEADTVILKNLNLTGTVQIQGAASSGGIVGRNHTGARININNCHVNAAKGSYIKGIGGGPNILGGIIGAAYGNSGNNANVISNCSVVIDSITCDVQCLGGIAGHFQEGSIENVTVKTNLVLVPAAATGTEGYGYNYDCYSVGMIIGTVGGTETQSNDDNKAIYTATEGHKVTISGSTTTGSTINTTTYENEPLYCNGLVGTIRNTGDCNSSDGITVISTYKGVSPLGVVTITE